MDALLNALEKNEELVSKENKFMPLKPLAIPKMVRGNIIVEIGDEEYCKGVEELKFSVDGKLSRERVKKALQKWRSRKYYRFLKFFLS